MKSSWSGEAVTSRLQKRGFVRSAVVVTVAVEILAASGVRADDPCADDIKQLCAEVRLGGGRLQECLQQNQARLSGACTAKLEAGARDVRSRMQTFGLACRKDMIRVCSEVRPGKGRILACLGRNRDHLSSSCEAEVEQIQDALETIAAVRVACRADADRLCGAVPPDAATLVECLQAHETDLSSLCRSAGPAVLVPAAQLVDAIEQLSSTPRGQEALQILQGIDTIAFSRNQILIQMDSYQSLGGRANGNRLLFNPQFILGPRSQYSLQIKVPIVSLYPYAPGANAQTGVADVGASFSWAFAGSGRVHQYLALGLQWKTAASSALGGANAATPAYAITVGLTRWCMLTGQVAWTRSFATDASHELNLLLLEPVVVVSLPGRSFVALDTRLGVNGVDHSFVPLMKAIGGIYIDRQKSLAISAWYQTALSTTARDQTFRWDIGAGLAYYFDW